jgi:uncharacterized 2Fe-2S/4Fe-4S cluster protein (DUF4445 family)
MPTVTFTPDGVSVEVAEGENLLRAALFADVGVTASCGGDGTCGKCKMVVERGDVDAKPSSKLTAGQVASGYVLACTATICGDVTVRIPAEARPGAAPVHNAGRARNTVLTAAERATRVPEFAPSPAAAGLVVSVDAPDLSDNASDASRTARALRGDHAIEDVRFTRGALASLPGALRGGGWTASVLVDLRGETATVVGVGAGAAESVADLAAAVDVGTTSIEVALIDPATGRILARRSEYNAQVTRGEDVITRVIAASKPEGLAELTELACETIARLVTAACEQAGVETGRIGCIVTAGNTVMTHLLYGISPASIRTEPYTPAATAFPWVPASEFGIPAADGALLGAVACPASWLGGDIVSGVVAAGIPWSDKLTLFIDIGTNGEIVLGTSDWLVSCSCSAGPAFEGGGILHGMRAAEGAVEQVRIDRVTLEPSMLTIGNATAVGICGSGIIDAVAELFLAGALDRSGRFVGDRAGARLRRGEHGLEYVLVVAEESATGEDIVITETDVDNLMRAKAAIFAGVTVLAESVGVELAAIDEVVIAGGFGHYLDLERVTALGLMPELDPEKFVFLGNGSLLGAELLARSSEMRQAAERVAEMMTYLELSANASFMDRYVSALFLPHTDTSLFPRTEELLSALSEAVS